MKKTGFLIGLTMWLITPLWAQSLPPGDTPPLTVFDRVAQAGSAKDFEGADYIIVRDDTRNQITELGVCTTHQTLVYKTLTTAGCTELSVLKWRYEPLSSFVDIREVNLIRGGEKISVPVNQVLDLPAPQSAIYWGDRLKMIQLPRLKVNDGIEIKLFRKGYSYALLESEVPDDERYIPPMPGEYFDIVLFQTEVPMVEKSYSLTMPVNKRIHAEVYNGMLYSRTTYDDTTTTYTWWIEDAPIKPDERYQADDNDVLPKVVIATVESWEAKSRWFFEVNEPQFEFTEAIKTKVDEIFAKAGVTNGTDEEKAFELLHWVAQNIRYSGQSMGEGEGFTLHPGQMIFEQRSGVCKDIAGMLITMMRAAGLDSYGAMTMAGSRIEEVPADQFNHCVVALRQDDGTFEMYDPTWVPNYRDIWSKYETEQHYLVGTPDGEPLSRIAYSPPEESPITVRHDAVLDEAGNLSGTFDIRGEGAFDSRLRNWLVYSLKKEVVKELVDVFSAIDRGLEIVSYKHGDLFNFDQPMWWKVSYRCPHYALPVDGGLEFQSPLLKLTAKSNTFIRQARMDWPDDRNTDLFFYATGLIEGQETLKLPAGLKVIEPENSAEIDETYAYYHTKVDQKKAVFSVDQKVEIRRRQIPPDGYAGFRKAMTEAKEYAETVFRAEKGEGQ